MRLTITKRWTARPGPYERPNRSPSPTRPTAYWYRGCHLCTVISGNLRHPWARGVISVSLSRVLPHAVGLHRLEHFEPTGSAPARPRSCRRHSEPRLTTRASPMSWTSRWPRGGEATRSAPSCPRAARPLFRRSITTEGLRQVHIARALHWPWIRPPKPTRPGPAPITTSLTRMNSLGRSTTVRGQCAEHPFPRRFSKWSRRVIAARWPVGRGAPWSIWPSNSAHRGQAPDGGSSRRAGLASWARRRHGPPARPSRRHGQARDRRLSAGSRNRIGPLFPGQRGLA